MCERQMRSTKHLFSVSAADEAFEFRRQHYLGTAIWTTAQAIWRHTRDNAKRKKKKKQTKTKASATEENTILKTDSKCDHENIRRALNVIRKYTPTQLNSMGMNKAGNVCCVFRFHFLLFCKHACPARTRTPTIDDNALVHFICFVRFLLLFFCSPK